MECSHEGSKVKYILAIPIRTEKRLMFKSKRSYRYFFAKKKPLRKDVELLSPFGDYNPFASIMDMVRNGAQMFHVDSNNNLIGQSDGKGAIKGFKANTSNVQWHFN